MSRVKAIEIKNLSKFFGEGLPSSEEDKLRYQEGGVLRISGS
jgi:hypothetical protein